MKKISVLVPTYNEQDNVAPLSEKIAEQFRDHLRDYDYELIFIDNDSTDDTRAVIRGLCSADPRIKAIFNARNFGQISSPYYGLLQSTGDCVIGICADFQDPVEMIPEFVKEWEAGYKIVLGQKTSSKESKVKYALRSFYYRFMTKNSDVKFIEHVTGFGLYDREFIDILRSLDDTRPFIKGVIAEMGYKIKLIPYEQPKRKSGKSKNKMAQSYDFAVQGITAYTKKGVRIAVGAGVLFMLVSIIAIIGCGIYKLFNWGSFDFWSVGFNLFILFVLSLQTLFIGVIGEYVLDINSRLKKRPLVIESERINF
jgi:glycosyltransferase involved in cell wall biosynthesis